MALYAITIFLSAFLLFQVQPLIVKIILPWFGGSAGVWSAALLFFQLLLLAGYIYAHALIRWVKARTQMALHVSLLAASCLLLPILPPPAWKPTDAGDPTMRILGVLLVTVGLPYFLLSATTPLLQAWFVRRTGSRIPYRLFALSNLGSLLALVSFPVLVEPRWTSRHQVFVWSGMYLAFALLCAAAAWVSRHGIGSGRQPSAEPSGSSPVERPGFSQLPLWASLAACASTLLLAITNHLSQSLAPIPLLWVVPLAVYLMTFILAFESERFYRRWIFLPCLVPALGAIAYFLSESPESVRLRMLISIFVIGLFICCMMCHGELARRKPGAEHLTLFYLVISLGGALGGIFVALIAPRIFRSYWELPLGLLACALLGIIILWNLAIPKLGAWPLRVILLASACYFGWYMAWHERRAWRHASLVERNFYGVLSVEIDPEDNPPARELVHGKIIFGSQMLDPKLRYQPTTYYGPTSGVGRAIRAMEEKGPVRVGVIGLGAGVLLAYGRTGDVYRLYEINPLVVKIARSDFSFYDHSPADKQILMGDARLTLEHQESQQFDLLAVDAFSGDAIPVHLLTREAMALYFRHLKPNGILAVHVSNHYLDLEPVCARGAEALGKKAMMIDDDPPEESFLFWSDWILISSDPAWFQKSSFDDADMEPATAPHGFHAWTDDYSSIYKILKLK
ncbi:MAG TPA: fused MFS/spermidine synthase [Terriglobia bacterium]|nr:fused MFS/spermidine synthase [Terriglobia bacterium]